jgi:hypothetical protein
MALTGVILQTVVQESQDAQQIRMWDESNWNGLVASVTDALIVISYYDVDGVLHTFDPYDLIIGADKTKFNQYLDKQAGHTIELSNLLINALPNGLDRLPDGYYIVTLHVTDGSYGAYSGGGWPKYNNPQAFLAKYRFMKRNMPAAILEWPITQANREANYDVFAVGLYLEAAEYAADLGLQSKFQKFMTVLQTIFDYYIIPEPW